MEHKDKIRAILRFRKRGAAFIAETAKSCETSTYYLENAIEKVAGAIARDAVYAYLDDVYGKGLVPSKAVQRLVDTLSVTAREADMGVMKHIEDVVKERSVLDWALETLRNGGLLANRMDRQQAYCVEYIKSDSQRKVLQRCRDIIVSFKYLGDRFHTRLSETFVSKILEDVPSKCENTGIEVEVDGSDKDWKGRVRIPSDLYDLWMSRLDSTPRREPYAVRKERAVATVTEMFGLKSSMPPKNVPGYHEIAVPTDYKDRNLYVEIPVKFPGCNHVKLSRIGAHWILMDSRMQYVWVPECMQVSGRELRAQFIVPMFLDAASSARYVTLPGLRETMVRHLGLPDIDLNTTVARYDEETETWSIFDSAAKTPMITRTLSLRIPVSCIGDI